MKKLFLVILAGGIMMTACKKEDVKKESAMQTTTSHSWKTSDWVMTKTNVKINGIACDEYTNKLTGQIVYEALEENENKMYYNLRPSGTTSSFTCKESGTTCAKTAIDGEEVFIVKKGAPIY